MSQPPRYTRRQQKADELCASVVRALSGEKDVQYRGRRLHRGQRPLPVHAPHLHPDPEHDDFPSFRGTADSIALRLQYSDAQLHAQSRPSEPIERLIVEMLEQLRVESLAPDSMPGIGDNLRYRFIAWSQAFHLSGVAESEVGILLYTLFQICWSRLHARPVPEHAEDFIEATRAAIVPVLGDHLAGLRRYRTDQARYLAHACAIASVVGGMIRTSGALEGEVREDEPDKSRTAIFRLLLNFDSEDAGTTASAPLGQSKAFLDSEHGYNVFTTQYDRQEFARSLVRRELLEEYRDRLDRKIAEHGINRARLVRELKALLSTPRRDGWAFGEEEGYLDGRRLTQLVSSPAERRLFRKEQHKPHADCLVSFLIDCSGSMKAHAEPVAIMIDVLVRALEQAGVSTEVLGFTTGAWNGGRAQRDWTRARSPKNPGRLNELFHMVFKDADHPWRRARPDIAALLKADLYREGIDGEAVEWACRRMQGRAEKRRILVVISDGCPMDTATTLANDEFYLASHLKEVVARHELHGDVEICGLGVGLDLSTYYRRSLATELPQSLNNELFSSIAQLIGGRRRY
ncbi:cobalt chelatase [Herbaspirillum sp. GCM10030257]|uniref:cobaltochelatase CobT-related protein n=1 Tax=Herbaspirillum sp. GCM10030257 TaxID=3273393 RepID=UPI0036148F09